MSAVRSMVSVSSSSLTIGERAVDEDDDDDEDEDDEDEDDEDEDEDDEDDEEMIPCQRPRVLALSLL